MTKPRSSLTLVLATAALVAAFVVSMAVPVHAQSLAPSTHAQTGALATAKVVCTGRCTLTSFEVNADSTLSAADWYILILDAASDPGNGAVTPAKCFQVKAGSSQAGANFPPAGPAFLLGVTIVVSSTGCFTETQGGAHAFIAGDSQ